MHINSHTSHANLLLLSCFFLQSPLLKQIVGDTVANLLKSVLGASSDKQHKRLHIASVQSLQVISTAPFFL